MAALGPGSQQTGDVADTLNVKATALGSNPRVRTILLWLRE